MINVYVGGSAAGFFLDKSGFNFHLQNTKIVPICILRAINKKDDKNAYFLGR
jgi:hypothetical protein